MDLDKLTKRITAIIQHFEIGNTSKEELVEIIIRLVREERSREMIDVATQYISINKNASQDLAQTLIKISYSDDPATSLRNYIKRRWGV